MKLRSLVWGVLALGVVAATPAKADFSVIRWPSGFCEIWNDGLPTRPIMPGYKVVAGKLPTIEAAIGALHKAVAGKACGWT